MPFALAVRESHSLLLLRRAHCFITFARSLSISLKKKRSIIYLDILHLEYAYFTGWVFTASCARKCAKTYADHVTFGSQNESLSSIYRRDRLSVMIWRGRRDSNPRSSDRQSDALSQLRYVPSNLRTNLVPKLRPMEATKGYIIYLAALLMLLCSTC
jgi:hypothetical protein